MEYAELVTYFERLEETSGRLEMTGILVAMLGAVQPEEMRQVVLLLRGAVAPDWLGVELGLAEKQVLPVLARAAGLDPKRGGVEQATKLYHELGDLGMAAEKLVQQAGTKQVGLMAFGGDDTPSLTVAEVHGRLEAIAKVSGSGSQDDKQRLLGKLLNDVGPLEARYVVRTVLGRLRLGVADMTFMDALAAWHLGRGVRSVQDMTPAERQEHEDVRRRIEMALDRRSDLSEVAAALAQSGIAALDEMQVQVGTPLRPMAAERLKTLPEIMEKQAPGGGGLAMDYKYDGLRVQAHVGPNGIKLYSRRLEDLTSQFPDVTAALAEAFPSRELIVEGEAVALDDDGKLRPFQDISRRRGRKTDLGGETVNTLAGEAASTARDITVEIPVSLFLFDVLYLDGKSTMDLPFRERRALVETIAGHERIQASTYRVADDVGDMEAFFQEAVAAGGEGIMCKQLGAPYKAGNRGYAWIKFKTDYTEELVDTMDLVAIGAFYGRGRRAGWYGALLCAARDGDKFASVCKLGTGFDDETLTQMTQDFAQYVVDEKPAEVDSEMKPDVWFQPKVVMEVQAAELSLSPIHRAGWSQLREGAGIAARFPRFTRWRDDKSAEQTTTVEELVSMYEQQGKRSD